MAAMSDPCPRPSGSQAKATLDIDSDRGCIEDRTALIPDGSICAHNLRDDAASRRRSTASASSPRLVCGRQAALGGPRHDYRCSPGAKLSKKTAPASVRAEPSSRRARRRSSCRSRKQPHRAAAARATTASCASGPSRAAQGGSGARLRAVEAQGGSGARLRAVNWTPREPSGSDLVCEFVAQPPPVLGLA
jgi:hypothetical protein